VVGALDADSSSYGLGIWADDGKHFCGIVFPPGSGPDAGNASLLIGGPGETGRAVARVGKPGSNPGVAACSIKNNRANRGRGPVSSPARWKPAANHREIQVVNLSTGAIEFERDYPVGNLGAQGTIAAQADWVLVAASPDARYHLAENGLVSGTSAIREVPTGKQTATLHGFVLGFNSDGSHVVLNAGKGESAEVQVAMRSDQKVLWHGPGVAQSMLARPHSSDIMIGVHGTFGDDTDIIAVDGEGRSHVVSRNLAVTWPCPCPIGL